jgi:hypothetical protein
VRPSDAEEVYRLFNEQVDQATADRQRSLESKGKKVACHAGCSRCCTLMVTAPGGETVTIGRWLSRPEQAEIKERFLARYPAWAAQATDLVESWNEAARRYDQPEKLRIAQEFWERGVMCAFNHEGRCSIYPVRPLVCRDMHALETPDNCVPEKATEVKQWNFPPLKDYLELIKPVITTMHAALRPGAPNQPLCQAVFDELTTPTAAPTEAVRPNDPCQCGSGRKASRCCAKA